MTLKMRSIFTPLLDKMPRKMRSELASRLNVSRITIWKWEKKLTEVSPINKLKINILCMEYNIDVIFKDEDTLKFSLPIKEGQSNE